MSQYDLEAKATYLVHFCEESDVVSFAKALPIEEQNLFYKFAYEQACIKSSNLDAIISILEGQDFDHDLEDPIEDVILNHDTLIELKGLNVDDSSHLQITEKDLIDLSIDLAPKQIDQGFIIGEVEPDKKGVAANNCQPIISDITKPSIIEGPIISSIGNTTNNLVHCQDDYSWLCLVMNFIMFIFVVLCFPCLKALFTHQVILIKTPQRVPTPIKVGWWFLSTFDIS
jgi:hypothetical protein